jgi:acetyl-CoA synthetase (ADP-forming)
MILHTSHRTEHGAPPRISIERILHPRSVAVFGASASIGKFGGRIIHFLVTHGFAGDIYPINRGSAEIAGHKAYPGIGAIPAAPDVAILAVPTERLIESVTEAAQVGVGC